MIHLYLSLPDPEPPDATSLVEEILAHDAGVGLVQTAAGNDQEAMRRIAGSHIRACDSLVAISDGRLRDETSQARRRPAVELTGRITACGLQHAPPNCAGHGRIPSRRTSTLIRSPMLWNAWV